MSGETLFNSCRFAEEVGVDAVVGVYDESSYGRVVRHVRSYVATM
jgi:hypothetical protein